MPELEWKAPAVADLMAIVDYISNDNPDAALALLEKIEARVAALPSSQRQDAPAGFMVRGSWSFTTITS